MNLKEQAIMGAIGPAMGFLNALAPELNKVQPENPVSQFVQDNIQTLLVNGDKDDMARFLSKVFIAQSNEHPEVVLAKLLSFYESFRIWYRDYENQN